MRKKTKQDEDKNYQEKPQKATVDEDKKLSKARTKELQRMTQNYQGRGQKTAEDEDKNIKDEDNKLVRPRVFLGLFLSQGVSGRFCGWIPTFPPGLPQQITLMFSSFSMLKNAF